jgi:hypothetical protein
VTLHDLVGLLVLLLCIGALEAGHVLATAKWVRR